MVKILTLPLKAVYFDQIKAGTKPLEYRLCTPYWTKRLAGAPFDGIVLCRGYPARDDAERRISLPWRGFFKTTLQHEHFGPDAVDVFAIRVAPTAQDQGGAR